MWKLCVVDDESNRTVVKLVRGDYTVGRAEDSTIRLTERNISRAHARLFRDGDEEWMLEDKGSYTGSFVNGERVAAARPLKHGDTIQLGDYRLELMDETQQGVDAKALDQAVTVAQLPDRLVVVQGPNLGNVYPLTEQKLLVGRGEECQIALDDASVSRVHVEVLRTEHGLMILDQGSSNGLRINGADLPSAMLRSGDVVELGDVRLKFVPAGVEDVVVQAAPASMRAVDAVAQPRSRVRGMMAVYGGAVVLVGAVIVNAMSRSQDTPQVTSVRVESAEALESPEVPPELAPSGAQKVLDEARGLASQGDVVMAHHRLAEIPQDSNLRQTPDFKAIEQRWADEILRAAGESPDPEERRRLLDKVAKTQEVDAQRRQRAADELAKLDEGLEAVGVEDLPTADGRSSRTRALKPGVAVNTARPKAAAPAPQTRRVRAQSGVVMTAKAQKPREEPGASDDSGEANDPPPPAAPPKPAPKPSAEGDTELPVRESPF